MNGIDMNMRRNVRAALPGSSKRGKSAKKPSSRLLFCSGKHTHKVTAKKDPTNKSTTKHKRQKARRAGNFNGKDTQRGFVVEKGFEGEVKYCWGHKPYAIGPEVHETNKFPIPHSYFREPEVCLYLNQVRNEQKKTRVTFKNVLSKLIPTECMRF